MPWCFGHKQIISKNPFNSAADYPESQNRWLEASVNIYGWLFLKALTRFCILWNKIPKHSFQSCCCCLVASSVQFSHSVVSDSLRPHGLQHARLLCLSPTPGTCSNSCPSSQWCHPTISPLSSPSPPAFNLSQHQGLFKWVSSSHQMAKYWSFSFSISSSNEFSGLISFRMDWLDLLTV